jgi:predicted DsbA family dithiol-disulfide isomerase
MLHLDVYSDIVCPWCYIGRARLAKALKLVPFPVEVHHRPFELQPDMPLEGKPFPDHLIRKFGGEARMKMMFQHVENEARSEWLEMHFDRIRRSPNTKASHRLVWLASEHKKGDEMMARLTKAHFADGLDLADDGVLGKLGREILGDAQGDDVDAAVRGSKGEAEVQAMLRHAMELGVSGVPLFVVGDRIAVSGAQPAEILAEFLEEANVRAA